MSPRVVTHTYTHSRLIALSFHTERFLELAGISRPRAEAISGAVEKKWLRSVGIYALDHDNKRVVEQEFAIDWTEHASLEKSVPVIDTSQPGWEDDLAVEVTAACSRFRKTVDAFDLPSVRFWVIFVDEIRADPDVHQSRCTELGLSYGTGVPKWRGKYTEFSTSVSALGEATILMRVYEGD